MINLPWFVRWGVDVGLFFVPAYAFANYPTTCFVFSAENRRIKRRKEVQFRGDAANTVAAVQELNKRLKLRQ